MHTLSDNVRALLPEQDLRQTAYACITTIYCCYMWNIPHFIAVIKRYTTIF